ncbi:MAG: hypothetical protein FJY85_16620 [Deltaproteobacteria bacterium]|nr:hypothetical protein [Deltaproteobacteria bacterium]
MITITDREYKATKRIKQGKKALSPPLDELARWVAAKWGVTVLNIVYDRPNSLHAARVQVILEQDADARKFRQGVNFDAEKQAAIKKRFLEIIGRTPSHGYDVTGLFVVFSAFAPLAKQEADAQIQEAEVETLKRRLKNPDIWIISRCFGQVTIFFFTEDQAKQYEAHGKKAEYACRYFELLKPHDEFGYLKEQEYTVAFDSKQNFDEKYQGSWFNYYH